MTLGLPRCFDLAWTVISKLLGRASFDGVNVTELYFESPVAGRADPSTCIPMHPNSARRLPFRTASIPCHCSRRAVR